MAVFYGKEDIRIEELPTPEIGAGELLVKVRGVGLCGTDVEKIVHEAVAPGTVLGHEVVGIVMEVGEGVTVFQVGQRVVIAHHVSCGNCHYCDRGSDSKCSLFLSTNIYPGGFAEYIRVPAPNVQLGTFAIPDSTSFEQAVFTEPLACCIRAIERSRLLSHDTILIVGAGSIGLLFIQLAKLKEVQVIVADLLPERLRLAKELGADLILNPPQVPVAEYVREATEGRGVDLVLSTVASQAVLDQGMSLVRDGGTIHLFAGRRGGLPVRLDLNQLHEREITLATTYSPSPRHLREAFALIVEGKVHTEQLISHRLSLSKLLEGVTLMIEHKALKVYFHI